MILAWTSEQTLLLVWIVFTAVALAGMVAVLVWAVRGRQFTGQDRARYLPLWSGIPEEDNDHVSP